MKKKFIFLMAAMMLLTMILPWKAVGQEKGFTEAYKFKTTQSSSNTDYKATYDIVVNSVTWNCPGNQNFSGYVRIGGKSLTNVDRVLYSKGQINSTSPYNITKITLSHGGKSNNNFTVNSVKIIVASNADFSTIVEEKTLTPTISNNTDGSFDFTPGSGKTWSSSCYFKFIFNVSNSNSSNYGLNLKDITFYKTTYTVTYHADDATGGSVPETTTHDAGSNVAVAYKGDLEKSDYIFSAWNTELDGSGSSYMEGGTITGISEDMNLYAQWISSSSQSIIINNGVSTMNVPCTAVNDGTIEVAFNNMDGFTDETVSLYNNSDCSGDPIADSWLYNFSITGNPKNTINYKASANAGVARTVYMRVSASYNSTIYYSNVVAVTQVAPTCTVTYNNNGGTGDMTDDDSPYAYGSTVTVLANSFTAPSGKVFDGWNTANDGSGTSYAVGATFPITGNTTLFAQWADIPTYTLVTDVDDIIPGAHYVIASSKEEGDADAMGAQGNKLRSTYNVVIIVDDKDGDNDDDIYIRSADVYEFVISGDAINNYTIYDTDNNGYIQSNNGGDISVNKSTLNNSSKWTIDIDNDEIIINNVENTTRYLQYNYNSGSPRYKGYTSMNNGYLFKKDNDTNIHPYSPSTYNSGTTTINGDIEITTANAITIANGAKVVFNGEVTSETASNLIVNDGGQLITTSANVKATVMKNITGAGPDPKDDVNYHWNAISSSVNTEKITGDNANTNLVTSTSGYELYRYDEPSATWENYKASHADFTTLQNGRGYLYRNEIDMTIEFTGTVNTSASYTVSAGGPTGFTGFNLIGNPYTHEIYKGGAFPNSATSSYALSTGFYKLNAATGAWVAGTDNTTAIAPNEGFLVQATAGGTITIDNTMNKTRYNNEYLQFTVANSEYEDVAYAWFDKGTGLSKINHRNANIPMLYINQEGQDYAIATMSDDTKTFNLNFKAMTTGKYTLSYKANGEFSYLHVIDRFTGEDIDMLLEGEYSFIGSSNDNDARFIVQLGYMPNYSDEFNDIFAYQNGNEIIVSGEGELQIFDVTGRKVMTTTINGAESVSVPAQGVYIFRLFGNEIKTQKIVVR